MTIRYFSSLLLLLLHHCDCCNHFRPTSSDHSRTLRLANAFVSASAGFCSVCQFLQSSHCRCPSRHESSNIDNPTEVPSLYALLESKRSTQLARLITQQAFANTTCVSESAFTRCAHFRASLGPIRTHMHLQRHIGHLSRIRHHVSLFLREVSTQPLELHHVSASCDVNPVLSDLRQMHHHV